VFLDYYVKVLGLKIYYGNTSYFFRFMVELLGKYF